MPKYNVRFRVVAVYETEIDATSYKEAFASFQEKVANNSLRPKPDVLRLSYEIETITLGSCHDRQSKRNQARYHRPKCD
jgi:hypothetical protein